MHFYLFLIYGFCLLFVRGIILKEHCSTSFAVASLINNLSLEENYNFRLVFIEKNYSRYEKECTYAYFEKLLIELLKVPIEIIRHDEFSKIVIEPQKSPFILMFSNKSEPELEYQYDDFKYSRGYHNRVHLNSIIIRYKYHRQTNIKSQHQKSKQVWT